MQYLNVSLLGLTGRAHPAITGVTTTHEVQKMRPHLKIYIPMLKKELNKLFKEYEVDVNYIQEELKW